MVRKRLDIDTIMRFMDNVGGLKMNNKTYTYPNGTQYKGEWKDDKRHGYGVWLRPDGMKYEGEWENDKPGGQGTLTYPDGRKRTGKWENGKFVGEKNPVSDQGQQMQELENENRELKKEIANLKQRLYTLEKPIEPDDLFVQKGEPSSTSAKSQQFRVNSAKGKKKIWWIAAAILFSLIVIAVLMINGGEEPIAAPDESVEDAIEEDPVDDVVDEDPADEVNEHDGAEATENSRTNPAIFNEKFILWEDDFRGYRKYGIEMTDLISGDEAWRLIKDANRFNNPPDEGMEYILVEFRVEVIETEDDAAISFNHAMFDVVSGAGVEYNTRISSRHVEPSFSTDLYEGAVHVGYTGVMVDKDDANAVLAINRGWDHEVWFDLRIDQ